MVTFCWSCSHLESLPPSRKKIWRSGVNTRALVSSQVFLLWWLRFLFDVSHVFARSPCNRTKAYVLHEGLCIRTKPYLSLQTSHRYSRMIFGRNSVDIECLRIFNNIAQIYKYMYTQIFRYFYIIYTSFINKYTVTLSWWALLNPKH